MSELALSHLQSPAPRPVAGAAVVLVVDDDPAMRMILGLSLKLFGYVMLAAADGEEALTIAREHGEIRVILMDVVMAGLSGKALADQLQASLPRASILYCSGYPASVLTSYGIDVNSTNFIQKPSRPPELRQKIEELIATC